MRPTNVFAAPEVPTTPKRKKTIYGDRYLIKEFVFVDPADSYQTVKEWTCKPVSVSSKAQITHRPNREENTVQEKSMPSVVVFTIEENLLTVKMKKQTISTEHSSRTKCLETNFQQTHQ